MKRAGQSWIMQRSLIPALKVSEIMSPDWTAIKFLNQSLLKDMKNKEFLLFWPMQWITGKEWGSGQLRYEAKIALYIISGYNRWQNCWDAFLKRGVLWCPDKGTPHPFPLPQMVVSELNRTQQAQKQYKGKKVRWEQGIPPLFSLILSNFLPAPYYLYAWNRLISSLSFATQYLQTTRKRLYSDNSIQSSAYIKWIQNTSLQLPSYR